MNYRITQLLPLITLTLMVSTVHYLPDTDLRDALLFVQSILLGFHTYALIGKN